MIPSKTGCAHPNSSNARSRSGAVALGICLTLMFSIGVLAQESNALKGTIVDSHGSFISNAKIEFRSKSNSLSTVSDATGSFVIPQINENGTLLVSGEGFASVSIEINTEALANHIDVQLKPAPLIERIIVTRESDERIPATPTSQFSLSREQIETSGSLTVDDLLRQVPGFTLFRRTGSLFANPTSQGVSLRGVGASGASRAVVLLDGVPLNSPFGGWIYWNRVPRTSVKSIAVFNGATSDLYGSGALGGVINIESRRVDDSFAFIETSYGNQDTPDLSFDAGIKFGLWSVRATGQALRTSGYIPVPKDQRGTVDTPAGTGDVTGSVTISRKLGQQGTFFVRASSFGESRKNGTGLQINNTRISAIDVGSDCNGSRAGDFSFRMYGSAETFNQNFSSIALNRNSELLTNKQRNPSQQFGFAGQWRGPILRGHSVASGIEARDVRGHSAEIVFSSSRPTANVDSGGRQRTVALFAQDTFQFEHKWFVTMGGRVDKWQNSRGYANRFPTGGGTASANNFADTSETAFSPRVSVLRTFNTISLSASFYRAFRAPTLNELYRNFRVGNVVTNANSALRAERLTGAEVGISSQQWSERLTLRGVFFWSQISDPVANVTLSVTPALITRQRQNLGATRVRGAEISVGVRLPKHFQISSEYLLTESTVLKFPVNASLIGLKLPQIPKNQLNLQLSYVGRQWSGGLQGRFVGRQFDDDQNVLTLPSFFTLDVAVSRRVSDNVNIFAAGQNVTGARYATGRNPTLTIGPPALWRVGLRIRLH